MSWTGSNPDYYQSRSTFPTFAQQYPSYYSYGSPAPQASSTKSKGRNSKNASSDVAFPHVWSSTSNTSSNWPTYSTASPQKSHTFSLSNEEWAGVNSAKKVYDMLYVSPDNPNKPCEHSVDAILSNIRSCSGALKALPTESSIYKEFYNPISRLERNMLEVKNSQNGILSDESANENDKIMEQLERLTQRFQPQSSAAPTNQPLFPNVSFPNTGFPNVSYQNTDSKQNSSFVVRDEYDCNTTGECKQVIQHLRHKLEKEQTENQSCSTKVNHLSKVVMPLAQSYGVGIPQGKSNINEWNVGEVEQVTQNLISAIAQENSEWQSFLNQYSTFVRPTEYSSLESVNRWVKASKVIAAYVEQKQAQIKELEDKIQDFNSQVDRNNNQLGAVNSQMDKNLSNVEQQLAQLSDARATLINTIGSIAKDLGISDSEILRLTNNLRQPAGAWVYGDVLGDIQRRIQAIKSMTPEDVQKHQHELRKLQDELRMTHQTSSANEKQYVEQILDSVKELLEPNEVFEIQNSLPVVGRSGGKIQALSNTLKKSKERISSTLRDAQHTSQENAQFQVQIASLKAELESLNEDLRDMISTKGVLESNQTEDLKKIKDLERRENDLNTQIQNLRFTASGSNQNKQDCERLARSFQALRKAIFDQAQTVYGEISSDEKSDYQAFQRDFENDPAQTYTNYQQKVLERLYTLNRMIEEKQTQIQQLEDGTEYRGNELNNAERQIDLLQSQLNALNREKNSLSQQLQSLSSQHGRAFPRTEPVSVNIEDNDNDNKSDFQAFQGDFENAGDDNEEEKNEEQNASLRPNLRPRKPVNYSGMAGGKKKR